MKSKIKMRGVIILDLEGTFNEIADVNRELEKFAENIGQDPVTINCVAGVKNRKGDSVIEDLDSVVFRHKGAA